MIVTARALPLGLWRTPRPSSLGTICAPRLPRLPTSTRCVIPPRPAVPAEASGISKRGFST